MSLRVGIGIIGLLVYLLVVFLLGYKAQADENLKQRLNAIESVGKFPGDENQMARPISDRLIKPAFERASKVVGKLVPLSKKSQDQLSETLRNAGIKKTAGEYFSRQATIFLMIGAAGFLVCRFLMKKAMGETLLIVLYVLAIYYVLARFMLKKQATQRMERIENELPEILDLLSVSVSAGLGFDQALQYVVERCQGDLAEELGTAQREIKLGRARNEALKALADRCPVESLRMFVSAIIQADILGIAISNILGIQADNVREQHKQHIEEKAAKLPVKILIPLVFCIFPNIFIILLGPAIPRVLGAFSSL